MILVEEESLAQQPKWDVPGINTTTQSYLFSTLTMMYINWNQLEAHWLNPFMSTTQNKQQKGKGWRVENEFGRIHEELYSAHENSVSWCCVRKKVCRSHRFHVGIDFLKQCRILRWGLSMLQILLLLIYLWPDAYKLSYPLCLMGCPSCFPIVSYRLFPPMKELPELKRGKGAETFDQWEWNHRIWWW